MTINNAQGNALKSAGIYLSFVACISHDQICAVSSRASSFEKDVISVIEGPRQLAENLR